MVKLWNRYSYAIILMLLSLSTALILHIQHTGTENKYLKVTVSQGDSLWALSEQYADQQSLSNKEFVNWVKKHNPNAGDKLLPGEKIIIPITNEAPVATQLASAPEK